MIQNARLSGIISESIVDGPGFRYVVFFQGCSLNCPDCHNSHTHDVNGGYLKSIDEIIKEINDLPHLRGVTFSGGEPTLQANACLKIILGINPKFDIMLFSGYTLDELQQQSKVNKDIDTLLNKIDYLVDGRFVLNQKTLSLKYVGSSNQRIIDMKKTFENGKIVIANI